MSTTKQTFLFQREWIANARQLPPEERAKIMLAILEYAFFGEESTDPTINYAISLIKARIDADTQHYEKIVEKKRKAANKRWHADAQVEGDAQECTCIPETSKSIESECTNMQVHEEETMHVHSDAKKNDAENAHYTIIPNNTTDSIIYKDDVVVPTHTCIRACEAEQAVKSLQERQALSLVYMRSKLTEEQVQQYLPEFYEQARVVSKTWPTEGELITHLASFMAKKADILNRQNNSNGTTRPNPAPASKQQPKSRMQQYVEEQQRAFMQSLTRRHS